MALSALAIKAVKGAERPFKLADSDGLYLLVTPSGNRYWRMNYRFGGSQKTLAFGVWPETRLSGARTKRDEARRLLAKGVDTVEQARPDKIASSIAAANTFGVIADEWLEKIGKDGLSEVTLKKIRWLLKQVRPMLGRRPLSEISAPELLLALRRLGYATQPLASPAHVGNNNAETLIATG